jgi:hypothetical protein
MGILSLEENPLAKSSFPFSFLPSSLGVGSSVPSERLRPTLLGIIIFLHIWVDFCSSNSYMKFPYFPSPLSWRGHPVFEQVVP